MPDKLPAKLYVQWLRMQAAAKRPYWYGCCHDACTKSKLQEKAKQFPEHYTADRMARYQADISAGQIAGDCVGGAIKGAAWTLLGMSQKVRGRLGCPDKSADGMYDYCKAQGMANGDISTLPEVPCVMLHKAGHVGVYIGNGKAVEWKGFAYGCVESAVKGRGWEHWVKLPWVDYAAQSTATETHDDGTEYVNIKGNNWRVREKADANAKVLGTLAEGEQVRVFGRSGDFYGIKSDKLKGYVFKDAID